MIPNKAWKDVIHGRLHSIRNHLLFNSKMTVDEFITDNHYIINLMCKEVDKDYDISFAPGWPIMIRPAVESFLKAEGVFATR